MKICGEYGNVFFFHERVRLFCTFVVLKNLLGTNDVEASSGNRLTRLQTSSQHGFKHVESKLFVIIRAIRKKVSYFNEPFRGHPLRKQKVGHCTKDNFLPSDKRFWYIPKTRPD